MENSYETQFLAQIFNAQNRLENILIEIVQNIFNLYDDDGDGKLDINDYISFVSDLMYISILMKRLDGTAYTMDNLMKFARWSSSNFETNLFREPQAEISYETFVRGVIYAVTENKHLPILGQGGYLCLSSFVPEILNYFSYYTKIAARRGWPTMNIPEESPSESDRDADVIHCPFQTRLALVNAQQQAQHAPVPQEPEPALEPASEPVAEPVAEPASEPASEPALEPALEPVSEPQPDSHSTNGEPEESGPFTPEQQIREYQRRRRIQYELSRNRSHHEHELMHERESQQPSPQAAQVQQVQVQAQQAQQQLDQQQLEERRRQIMEQQIQHVQRLQQQLRNHIRRQEVANQNIDQFGDDIQFTTPPHILEDAGEIVITKETMGYDPIDGDVSILDYIGTNPVDNIVFRMNEHYYMASKDRIRSMIQVGEKDNSIFYGCMCEITGNWTDPATWGLLEETVIPEIRYFNIQQLGLPIRYVLLKDIQAILDGEHHFFIVEKPQDYTIVPSFASDNILNHGVGSMSGAHCQDGQSDIIYTIKKFTPKDENEAISITGISI